MTHNKRFEEVPSSISRRESTKQITLFGLYLRLSDILNEGAKRGEKSSKADKNAVEDRAYGWSKENQALLFVTYIEAKRLDFSYTWGLQKVLISSAKLKPLMR